MDGYNCKTCLYYDDCKEVCVGGCDYYEPEGTYAEDAVLNTYIERQRKAFRSEWFQYTAENFE